MRSAARGLRLASCVLMHCVIAALLTLFPSVARAQVGAAPGQPWVGERGITETVVQIMARDALLPPVEGVRTNGKPKRVQPDRSRLPLAEGSPRVPSWPQGSPFPREYGQRTPQTIGASFLGSELNESGYVPPDSMGDVSTTQVVVAANGRIKVFSKAGAPGALNTTMDNFFESVRAGSGCSDPRVRYDRLTGRWFILIINVSSPNRIMLAVSDGPEINGQSSFTFYQFQQDLVGPTPNPDTGLLADYPSLGIDANGIYTGANMFGTLYTGTTAWVIRKSSVLGGGPIVVTAFRQLATASGPGVYSPRGVNNDDPNSTDGFIIGSDNASFGLIDILRISDPGGTPSIAAAYSITVPATTGPIPVPCLGSAQPLDALNDRLYSADMHLNRITGERTLWTSHAFQVDSFGNANDTTGMNGSRWYQFGDLTGTPTLIQAGTLFDPSEPNAVRNFWFPAVVMTGQGHMAMGCSAAGANEMASIAVAGRLAGDPLGQIRPPTTAAASTTTYNVIVVPPRPAQRWGDYSNSAVDPSDDMTVWTFQEYCNDTDSWGVRAIQLLAPPPATPTLCMPAEIAQGTLGAVLTVDGESVDGSGFFDPEPAYPNHISSTISGPGITVTSTQWISPTQIIITADVAPDADLGGRTITVTNPDGQSATSASAIVTIVGAPCDPDVNCDGAVNGFDVEVMEQAVNGDLSNFCQLDADYNHDGAVNGFDVEAVEQSVNGAPCP